MELMIDSDPTVRYEAILAVQKIMITNWEFLGSKLSAPAQAK